MNAVGPVRIQIPEFFQYTFPHERSDLSHWRKRLGDKLELLLAESLRVALATGALRAKDLARVTVDTTVQPKAISFPTDAKLLHAAIRGLNRLATRLPTPNSSTVTASNCACCAPARPDHSRYPPQDRRQHRDRSGL